MTSTISNHGLKLIAFVSILATHLALSLVNEASEMPLSIAGNAETLSIEQDAAKSEASVLGIWEQQYEFMGVKMVDRYEIKKAKTEGFEGVLTREGKEISKLEDIRIDGDKVTFTAKGSENGTDWKVDFKGTVKGDDIDGNVKITVNDQSFESPWKPKRIEKGK